MNVINRPFNIEITEVPPNLFERGAQADANASQVSNENAKCGNCSRCFTPRSGTGGRPQIYCSALCRRAADAERKGNSPQREQRAPQRAENSEPRTGQNANGYAHIAEAEWLAFDWQKDLDDATVPEQRAVTVYLDRNNCLAIRQECSRWEQKDSVVVIIDRNSLEALLQKLRDVCGVPSKVRA